MHDGDHITHKRMESSPNTVAAVASRRGIEKLQIHRGRSLEALSGHSPPSRLSENRKAMLKLSPRAMQIAERHARSLVRAAEAVDRDFSCSSATRETQCWARKLCQTPCQTH